MLLRHPGLWPSVPAASFSARFPLPLPGCVALHGLPGGLLTQGMCAPGGPMRQDLDTIAGHAEDQSSLQRGHWQRARCKHTVNVCTSEGSSS